MCATLAKYFPCPSVSIQNPFIPSYRTVLPHIENDAPLFVESALRASMSKLIPVACSSSYNRHSGSVSIRRCPTLEARSSASFVDQREVRKLPALPSA